MVRFRAIQSIAWSLLIGGMILWGGPAFAAAKIVTQPPCYVINDVCRTISAPVTNANTDLGTIDFRSPGKGSALLTFNGSLVCSATTGAVNRVVDIMTGITDSPNGAIGPTKPGGLRLATVLSPVTSQTFNLAATAVVTFDRATSKTFRYQLWPYRFDAGVSCKLYNDVFSIVFIP